MHAYASDDINPQKTFAAGRQRARPSILAKAMSKKYYNAQEFHESSDGCNVQPVYTKKNNVGDAAF